MTAAAAARRKRRDEHQMVPDATFTSYYGRPVVKASPWEADIPAYLFLGGLAAGSSMLGAGADLTGRPALRRVGRLGALAAISVSFAALVHDLGRPSRFVNMLRVAKPTSPMSVGTWILTVYGPLAGAGRCGGADRPDRGQPARARCRSARELLVAAPGPPGSPPPLVAPAVASYTAVLLADTATPTWNGGARGAAVRFRRLRRCRLRGLGMMFAPPARQARLGGWLLAARSWSWQWNNGCRPAWV